ncbi:MAG: FkbM family methyltransferase [Gemmatimonadales bacterium]
MIRDRARADQVEVLHCRYGRMLALTNDKYIGAALRDYGEYSESEVMLWRQILKPDAIVVDAGANCGAHTVALASLVPQGVVVAFEPLRAFYHILCGNLALNGLTNVIAHHAALGAEPGGINVPALDLTLDENYGGFALPEHQGAPGNRVPLLRLDDVLPRVDMIKADVEGMEGDVLRGAERLIRECAPVLYLEANPGPTQQPLIDQLDGMGYMAWWHHAPHFHPANYRGLSEDHYPGIVSWNLLALPASAEHQLNGFPRALPTRNSQVSSEEDASGPPRG